MKKLFSLVLVLAIMLSVCVVSAMSTAAQTTDGFTLEIDRPVKEDLASTKAQEYYYSYEPYAEVTPINGYVLGYIGDVDGDSIITVLDATTIQKYKAQLIELSDDAWALADVDFDWEVTVLDATEIQKWIAKISDNEYITHTLYIEDTAYVTFDQIADFLLTNGEYYEDEEISDYSYYYYEVYNEETQDYFSAEYYPALDNIDFSVMSYEEESGLYFVTTLMTYRGNTVFDFASAVGSDDDIYYYAYGSAELVDIEDEYVYEVDCTDFFSEYYNEFSEVEDIVISGFTYTLETADYELWDYIDGFVTDLLY